MKNPWSVLFEKIAAIAVVSKLLENLTSAIRAVPERKGGDADDGKKITAEICFPIDIEEQRKTEQDQQYRIQRWIACGTWVTCAAGSIYAGIAWLQWNEVHKQTVNTSRAWLGYKTKDGNLPIVVDRVQVVPKLSIEAHYTIENFGNGPAIKVISAFFVETDKDMTILKRTAAFICESSQHFATGAVPGAAGVFNPGPMGFILFPKQTYNESQTRSGNAMPDLKWMFMMGCVSYLDQFKKWHWTRFSVVVGDGNNQISDASPRKLYTLFNDTDETGSKDPY